ncbi:MAG TPA: NPCBM/NEW2 domain-containing protein [Tepidisphaeraceae bacterium]|jgi:hypothetical protein|nr:NPCBM/NEW2 domain-containing protein [Tepidisphaeraceae bacterium]
MNSHRGIEPLEGRVLLAAHIAGNTTVYSTIQAAVNAAAPGAVINVDAGSYAEEVTVNKPLTLRGAQAGIDARSSGRGTAGKESTVTGVSVSGGISAAFDITSSDVTLDGFTVQGETNGSNIAAGAGIAMAPNIAGAHILNNIVQNNVSGLFLSNNSATDQALIQHNLFQNNNNAGVNGGRGIYTDGSIFGTVITNVDINANTFTNNHGSSGTTGAEAAIAFEAQTPGKQFNINVTNNIFTSNGKAVLFFDTNNLLFQGNTVTNHSDPSGTVRFEGGDTNVSILNNTIQNNNGGGVVIDGKAVPYDSSNFTIEFNNFANNSKGPGDKNSVVADDTNYDGPLVATNNWWNSASGPGGDGPGTGDTIYGNGHYTPGGYTLSPGGDAIFSPWATTAFATPAIPGTPSGLTASATAGSTTPLVTLNWQAGSGAPDGYEIDRSTDGGATFIPYAYVPSSSTTFTDANVTASTAYSYRICANNASGASAFTAAVSVTTPGASVVNLSSLSWVSATVGYGTIQKNLSILGNTLSLRGKTYTTGIGTHAASDIVYNIGGAYATFVADAGIDDETGGKGSVDFQVIGDGKVLYDSGIVTGASPAAHININVAGVKQLALVATNGIPNDIDYDHSDWAGAQLLTTATAPTIPSAPTGLTAQATSATQINLAWTNTASNQTGVIVQRSTDGTNFSPLITLGAAANTYSDTSVSPSTKYYYRVLATNAAGNSTPSPVASATTLAAGNAYLSDLTPVSATVGWGTLQDDQSIKGNPITLRGVVYAKGLGAHAQSTIVYNTNGNYSTFVSDVGLDDETAGQGAVDFQVIGDGKVLFDSGVLTGASPVVHISVSIAGVKQLTLQANPGVAGSIDFDHADWAGAELLG